jgi:CubicO group peptidase (beta-lactamase class C family)
MGGGPDHSARTAHGIRAAIVITFARAGDIIRGAVDSGAFPAASLEVGRASRALWRRSFGSMTYDADAEGTTDDTIFDLASLTKVICTTTLAMRAVDEGLLDLDSKVAAHLTEWRGADRESVTIRDLLAHASGLTAYLPFYRDITGRAEFEPAICHSSLEYAPRTQSIYSDLGFILLGFILEDVRAGARSPWPGAVDLSATLAAQFHRLASFVTSEPLLFNPPRTLRARCAPTEMDPWRGRVLTGEVHDENAWALGGAAGHAGLFGTVGAVGAFARAALLTIQGEPVLAKPETMAAFIRRTNVPGSSRALGWDTMLPTSSCGTRLSVSAIGHTGFTGTSLWIDHEQDLYIVLLTNRVHPTRDNDRIRQIRPAVHDAVVEDLRGTAA